MTSTFYSTCVILVDGFLQEGVVSVLVVVVVVVVVWGAAVVQPGTHLVVDILGLRVVCNMAALSG